MTLDGGYVCCRSHSLPGIRRGALKVKARSCPREAVVVWGFQGPSVMGRHIPIGRNLWLSGMEIEPPNESDPEGRHGRTARVLDPGGSVCGDLTQDVAEDRVGVGDHFVVGTVLDRVGDKYPRHCGVAERLRLRLGGAREFVRRDEHAGNAP